MKYIVEVTTSNPSHEHMALRRVQKKTNFVVEASNEAEALMRARGKFRSLGHYVHDVQLVEQQVNERISLGAPVSDQLKAKEKLAKSMEDKPDTAVARIDKSIENTKDKDPEYSKRVSAFKDEYLKKKKEADAGETTIVAKEEVERIDEISKENLVKYVKKAVGEVGRLGYEVGRSHGLRDAGILDDEIDPEIDPDEEDRNREKLEKRTKGIERASTKLAKEEFEYIEEKLTAADPASKWISDFVASDNPKFKGKSKKERIRMALGAKYAAMRNEEVEQVIEEVVAESEGRVAVTPKEKALAAHHGDPKRITYGDVVKARIKSGKKKIEEADASKPVMSIADRVKARQDAKKAEAKAKDDAEAKDYLKSTGMSDANIAKRMEKPMREQAQDRPVPKPNATPKPPKEPKEPGTTDYTKELELDPSFPRMHPLELERPKIEAEVRKRQAELAKQAAEKAKMKKEEVEQIDEAPVVQIVKKIVKAVAKKGDDVVRQVPTAVGTEKTVAAKTAAQKADTTFQATGGARVPDVKKMSADEYKDYYQRRRRGAPEPELPSSEPTPPTSPSPASPGARVIDLEKRRPAHAISQKAMQNPYAKLANEQRTLMTYEKGEKQKSKPAEPGMETTMDTETKGQTETQMDKEIKTKNMAQKLIDLAKSKLNKINTKPEMDADVKGK